MDLLDCETLHKFVTSTIQVCAAQRRFGQRRTAYTTVVPLDYDIIILAGVPGVARDEKLRKQIFEIACRDKGWIG
jgi:hypothetical protein